MNEEKKKEIEMEEYVFSLIRHQSLAQDFLAHRETLTQAFQQLSEYQQFLSVCRHMAEFYFRKNLDVHGYDYDKYVWALEKNSWNQQQRKNSIDLENSRDVSNLKTPLMILFFTLDDIFKRHGLVRWQIPFKFNQDTSMDLVSISKACRNIMAHWNEGVSMHGQNQKALEELLTSYTDSLAEDVKSGLLNSRHADFRLKVISDFMEKKKNEDMWQIPLYATFCTFATSYEQLMEAIVTAPVIGKTNWRIGHLQFEEITKD